VKKVERPNDAIAPLPTPPGTDTVRFFLPTTFPFPLVQNHTPRPFPKKTAFRIRNLRPERVNAAANLDQRRLPDVAKTCPLAETPFDVAFKSLFNPHDTERPQLPGEAGLCLKRIGAQTPLTLDRPTVIAIVFNHEDIMCRILDRNQTGETSPPRHAGGGDAPPRSSLQPDPRCFRPAP